MTQGWSREQLYPQGGPKEVEELLHSALEPAHPRDTSERSAIDWAGHEPPAPIFPELPERSAIVVGNADVHMAAARILELEEENARLKELLGAGPAVIVGVESIPAFLKHLEGDELNLGIRTWQFPQRAVAYLLEAALDVAKDPANGLCADSVLEQEG